MYKLVVSYKQYTNIKKLLQMDLVYFARRIPDTSNTSGTRATRTTRLQQECNTSGIRET